MDTSLYYELIQRDANWVTKGILPDTKDDFKGMWMSSILACWESNLCDENDVMPMYNCIDFNSTAWSDAEIETTNNVLEMYRLSLINYNPKAIEFMERVGLEEFRQQTRWLATEAETRLCRLFGTEPMADRSQGWYGSMAHVPLPPGDWSELQARLWASHSIEVPVINFDERWFIRVSCHLYNNTSQLETLKFALGEHLGIKVT